MGGLKNLAWILACILGLLCNAYEMHTRYGSSALNSDQYNRFDSLSDDDQEHWLDRLIDDGADDWLESGSRYDDEYEDDDWVTLRREAGLRSEDTPHGVSPYHTRRDQARPGWGSEQHPRDRTPEVLDNTTPCPRGYWLANESSRVECRRCSTCPAGSGVVTSCSGVQDTQCRPCVEGSTYSLQLNGDRMCIACSRCAHAHVEQHCSLHQDAVCGACLDGYFMNYFRRDCQPCSYCDPVVGIEEVECANQPQPYRCFPMDRRYPDSDETKDRPFQPTLSPDRGGAYRSAEESTSKDSQNPNEDELKRNGETSIQNSEEHIPPSFDTPGVEQGEPSRISKITGADVSGQLDSASDIMSVINLLLSVCVSLLCLVIILYIQRMRKDMRNALQQEYTSGAFIYNPPETQKLVLHA